MRLAPGALRPGFWRRHDLTVILVGALLLAAGGVVHHALSRPDMRRFDKFGLIFNRPAIFLPPSIRTEADDGRKGAAHAAGIDGPPYHAVYDSPIGERNSLLRLEVLITERPTYNNLRAARALDRASEYGELVWVEDTEDVKISGRLWVRSQFRYAFKTGDFDSPKVASAVEFATLNGQLVYVVTMHGSKAEAAALEAMIAPTLTVDANAPAAVREED